MKLKFLIYKLKYLLLALLSLVFSTNCSSATSKTPVYFQSDFKCMTDFVPAEKDKEYLINREVYVRKLMPKYNGQPIIVAGESTAALMKEELLKEKLPGYSISNQAIPGETTVLFLASINDRIIRHKPSVVVLAIGGNDILGGRCLTAIERNVSVILNTIQDQSPRTRIILVSIPPVIDWNVSTVAVYLNERLKGLAEQNRNVDYLDLWPELADPEKPVLAEEFHIVNEKGKKDKIHFNPKGYDAFARLLKSKLGR